MGTENKPVLDFAEYMRNNERRQTQQERRKQIYNAADLLGPGFGPTATEVTDWNSEEASFNGFFWGQVGSLNSPDSSMEWAGITIAEDDRDYGVQKLFSVRVDPVVEFSRRFSIDTTGTLVYSDWVGDGAWHTAGCTAVGGLCTISGQSWRRRGGMVAVNVSMVLTTAGAAAIGTPGTDGDVANTVLVQVPAEIVPTAGAGYQSLSTGTGSAMSSWFVTPTGAVEITATTPGATIASGTVLAVSGTYML